MVLNENQNDYRLTSAKQNDEWIVDKNPIERWIKSYIMDFSIEQISN
jgi:hypothetical protein